FANEKDVFKKLCMQLPITIEKIVKNNLDFQVQSDTVIEELSAIENDFVTSLYKLVFSKYNGLEF
ncbi:Eco47II family restriction endonuclease, partial [Mycoplasmopsis bovis]